MHLMPSECDDHHRLPTIDNAMYMRPGDTRQFLFLVDRTEQAPSPQKELLILGRMEYSWSSAMGEAGAWTSEQLTAPAPQLRPFSLLIEDIPGEVFADSPFTVKFTLVRPHLIQSLLHLALLSDVAE